MAFSDIFLNLIREYLRIVRGIFWLEKIKMGKTMTFRGVNGEFLSKGNV